MALFNFSTDWETNKTGDELCETFIQDGRNRKKKYRNKNKHKIKLDNKFIQSNEHTSLIINTSSNKSQHDSNISHKILKSKKHILKKIKKQFGNINMEVNGKEEDKIPLNNSFTSEFNKQDNRNKKSFKRKRALSETTDGSDISPLWKKQKTEKRKKNTDQNNDHNSAFTKPKVKNKKKQIKKEKSNGEENTIIINNSSSKKIKNILKNAKVESILHNTKHIKKINRKLKEKKNKLKRSNSDSEAEEPSEENITIDPIQLKKRKKQLEKLQNFILDKQKKHSPPLIKKEEPVLTLRQKMMQKLKAARFRFLNEQIYTTTSKETEKIFKRDPDAFKAYHEGYRQQVKRWPLNPLDRIIKSINKMPKTHVIADFGCGEARLAKSIDQKVHSFDLVAANDTVIACDMAHVPLQESSVDIAVFCLSLMGTNLKDYLLEANRVLKKGGLLKIAEVESRFDDIKAFTKDCEQFGFKKTWMDLSHNLFYFIDLKKESSIKGKKKLPSITLQPCLYKKR